MTASSDYQSTSGLMSTDGVMKSSCSSTNALLTVYKRYDDNFEVRAMTVDDIDHILKFYVNNIGLVVCRSDLETALKSFPASERGFYVGTIDGQVVGAFVALPWGNDILYGSCYYVDPKYQGRGFAYRIRDEVALVDVGSRTLCIDSVDGKAAESNRKKFGCCDAFQTIRVFGTAANQYDFQLPNNVTIVSATTVDFDKILDYDNKCFVSSNFEPRAKFLIQQIKLPRGAAYVALDDISGNVIGFACRRAAVQPGNHIIGPVYADSRAIAECLTAKLCQEVAGDEVTINYWNVVDEVKAFIQNFNFREFGFTHRHHVNRGPDWPGEIKPQVYAIFNSQVCGF